MAWSHKPFGSTLALDQGSSISFSQVPNSANNTKPRATDLYIYIYIYVFIIVAFVKMVTRYIFRFTQISINVIYIQTSTSDPLSVRRMKLCMPSYGTAESPGRCTEQLLQEVHGDWPGKEALTIALADGSLLVAEKPVWVVTEGAPPIPVRRERRSRRAAMVTHS